MYVDNLPKGIKLIGGYAFENCGHVGISVIPSPVMELDSMCLRGCSAMTTVRFLGKPNLITPSAFYLDRNVHDVYVPWSSGEVEDAPWGMTNATIHYDCDVSDYYIQDGLYAWYDGVRNTRNSHDPNATVWENLGSAGSDKDLTLYPDHCSVESDHLHLNGTGLAATMGNTTLFGNQFTIEVVYARGTASKGIIIFGYDANIGNPIIYTDSSGNVVLEERQSRKGIASSQGEVTYFAKYRSGNLIKNGEYAEMSTTEEYFDDLGFSKGMRIGDADTSVLDSCPGNGDIYCIRFYNRVLSDIEIAHNYNIDRVRFRLYRQESSSSSSSSN